MDATTAKAVPSGLKQFSDFIRTQKAEIIAHWEREVRRLPVACHLERLVLIDQVPKLLDRIADIADELANGEQPRACVDLADVHAVERLDAGFDLDQVVAEYSVLRDSITRLWLAQTVDTGQAFALVALDQTIDRAIAASVQRYTQARDATLQALDRISAAALEVSTLDAFLEHLLVVLVETTAAVDTATILLVDGDALRVRASVGLENDLAAGLTIPIGEGFAGRIAQTGEPLEISSADTDPLVLSNDLRAKAIKGLFGMPLVDGGKVIGVAHIGSATARQFSKQDRRLFEAMVNRATSAITVRLLRDALQRALDEERARKVELELRSAELEAVIDSIPDAMFIGTELGITRANRAALELVGWQGRTELPPITELLRTLDPRDARTGRSIGMADSPFMRALTGQNVAREVVVRDRETGGDIFLRSSAAPIRQGDRIIGAVSVNTDISERQRAQMALEEALREQHIARAAAERNLAVLDTILAASAVGIGFIDTDLRYVRVSDALAGLNGRPAEEHLGRTVREIIGEAADLVEPILRQILATRKGVENLELELAPPSTPDQLRTFVASYVPVITSQGDVLGIGAVIVEITDRKRAESALRASELRFRSIADNIPQLAWMADETGSIIWYNRRWYDFTGTTWKQMSGWGWSTVHHPDHVDRVVEKFKRHMKTGELWEDTFPLRAADGHYRWFLSRAVPIRDEQGRVVRWFGSNTDVTEHRFMHEAVTLLSSSLDYHDTLAQVVNLAVPALADWAAIDVVEANGVKRIAVAPHDPAISESALASRVDAPLVARDRTLGTLRLGFAEPRRRYSQTDRELIEDLGRRIGLAIDNTRLVEEIRREARVREEILAVVSHDLKNPLGTIHLAATMLLGAPELPPRKHLEAIERAATRMDHLIGDLLDMASIEAGRLAIERKPVSVDEVVRDVLEANERMAREKQIDLVRHRELGGGMLDADRERLTQVFGNLIGNALKFCRPGDTITVHCTERGDFAEFCVSDTGPGISAAEQPHIFEPYWSAKKYAKKGTGLGLFICKGIVEAHGGRIWVTSEPGHGAAFCFTIPFAKK